MLNKILSSMEGHKTFPSSKKILSIVIMWYCLQSSYMVTLMNSSVPC